MEVKMKNNIIWTDQTKNIGLHVTHTMLFLCSEDVFHKFQIVLTAYCEYYKLKIVMLIVLLKIKFQMWQN